MFHSCEVNFKKKSTFLPIEKFPSLVIRWCYNALLSNFLSVICEVVAYGRLKTKENFKLLALKMVVVAYERCCLQEVPNIGIWLGNFSILENWSLRRGGRNPRFHCISNQSLKTLGNTTCTFKGKSPLTRPHKLLSFNSESCLNKRCLSISSSEVLVVDQAFFETINNETGNSTWQNLKIFSIYGISLLEKRFEMWNL